MDKVEIKIIHFINNSNPFSSQLTPNNNLYNGTIKMARYGFSNVYNLQNKNVAIYKSDFNDCTTLNSQINLERWLVYGASGRIGSQLPPRLSPISRDFYYSQNVPNIATPNRGSRLLGNKEYELTDHLGNVRVMLSDIKMPADITSDRLTVNYTADVLNAANYYPYGEEIPQQTWNAAYELPYLFGYNGMLKDNHISGEGNAYYTLFREYDPTLGRWWSADPKRDSFPTFSPYLAFKGNPIKFVDIFGDIPTDEEAAEMSAHVYGGYSDDILTGGWRVSYRNFDIDLNNPDNGLKSQVYERFVDGKVTEYVYATAGSDDVEDWENNALQAFGKYAPQYDQSANNAREISKELNGTELTFVGHSLGGSEASLNALITNNYAITFNASGLSNVTKLRYNVMNRSEQLVKSWIMMTDPVNIALSPLDLGAIGSRYLLTPTDVGSIFNGHSMDNVMKSFK